MSERNFTPPAGTPDYLTHQAAGAHIGEAYALVETMLKRLDEQTYPQAELIGDLREVLRLLGGS